MSSQTNIALNSRSMNSIITLSDGVATIENGELNCSNINSDNATIQNLTISTITGDFLINCKLINCTVSANPTVALGIVSKQYQDSAIALCAKLASANTFTQTNTFDGQNIYNNLNDFKQTVIFREQTSFTLFCPLSYKSATQAEHVINQTYLGRTYGGVFLCKALTGANNYMVLPIPVSRTNLTNYTGQPTTSGSLTTSQSGTVVGNYSSINVNDADTLYIVYPNFGLIVYQNASYTGTVLLNYKNTTSDSVVVSPSSALGGTSVKVYFNDFAIL